MLVKSQSLVIFIFGLCAVRKRFVDGQVVTFQIERPAVYNGVLFEGENVTLSCSISNLPTDVNNNVFITIGSETFADSPIQAPDGIVYLDIPSISEGERQLYYCLVNYYDDTTQANVSMREETILNVYSTKESPHCVHDASSSPICEGDTVNLYCYYSRAENEHADFEWQESCGEASIITSEVINLNESQTSVLKTKNGIVSYFGDEAECYFICLDRSASKMCTIVLEKKPRSTSPTTSLSDNTTDRVLSTAETTTATTTTSTTVTNINQPGNSATSLSPTTLVSDRSKVMTTTQPPSNNPQHLTSDRDNTTTLITAVTTTLTTATSTNINQSTGDNNGILIGLLVLVGVLILLVSILIILHLCDKRKRGHKTFKQVSTISHHIYENPSFRNHVFGSLPGTARNSPQMSRLSKHYLGSFGTDDDVVSSQTSLTSAEVKVHKGVADASPDPPTKNEVLAVQSMKDIRNSDDTTVTSESFDGDSTPTTADLNISDNHLNSTADHPDNVDDTYVDMEGTSRRHIMKESPSYASHEETDNKDDSDDVIYTLPTKYSRGESKDDTYGVHMTVGDDENFTTSNGKCSDESPPVPALERLSEVAEYIGNDFTSLYAIVVKSKSQLENRNQDESVEEEEDPIIHEENNGNDISDSSSNARRMSKSSQIERPKFAPPAPPTNHYINNSC